MRGTFRDATLAGHRGEGYIDPTTTEAGDALLEGRWRAGRSEAAGRVYAELNARYLAREVIAFRSDTGAEVAVFIARWFGETNPDCLIIRDARALA